MNSAAENARLAAGLTVAILRLCASRRALGFASAERAVRTALCTLYLVASAAACAQGKSSAVDVDGSGPGPIDAAIADASGLPGVDAAPPSDAPPTAIDAGPVPILISEFVANHFDTDNREFVEISGPPNTDLGDHAVLVVEGNSTDPGVVDVVISVGATDAGGHWKSDYLSNMLENDNLSLLLVRGFSAAPSVDLDTDNDGTFDTMPWDALVDSVAVVHQSDSGVHYGGVEIPHDQDGGAFIYGGASRMPENMDTDSPTDWTRNDFDGAGLPGFDGVVAEAGEGINTPGAANQIAN